RAESQPEDEKTSVSCNTSGQSQFSPSPIGPILTETEGDGAARRHSHPSIMNPFHTMSNVAGRLGPRLGFSMIEAMLVISMLGIIASVSLGKLHDVIVQQRVLRAASAVQNTVENAFAVATRN